MIRRIVPLLLILVLLIAPSSAAVTRTWNQSSTSSALSGCMDENYASITCPDFNATEPWSSMGRVNISGQTMVYVPKFWYRVDNVSIGGFHYMNFSVSATPLSGYSVHPWFGINGTTVTAQYIGAYEASIYNVTSGTHVGDPASVNSQPGGDLLSSVAGQKPVSGLGKASLTLPGFRNTSHSRGLGWELQSFNGVSAIQLLYVVEKGNWNSQTTIGTGVTQITDDGVTNMAIPTGLTGGSGANSTDCGNYTCSVATVHYQTHQNTNQVSYRGWEGSWGNLWEGVDGLNIKADRNPWIATYGFASDVFTTPYIDTSLTLPSSNGYISNLVYSSGFNYGFLPSAVAGSSSTYITDGFFQAAGNRIAYLGGGFSSTTNAGLFSIYAADASTSASRFYGSRLAYTPPVVANFTHTNTSSAFAFTDESFTISTLTGVEGIPTSWNWSFGDDSVSSLQNPTHTYAAAGTYPVNLTVSDGTNYATIINNIASSSPAALEYNTTIKTDYIHIYESLGISFNATPQFGEPPLDVAFVDNSTGAISAWYWNFGDGNTSTLRNTSHTYVSPGNYPVSLNVTGPFGNVTSSTVYVGVAYLNTTVSATPTEGPVPLDVQFTSTPTGLLPDSYYWIFGDGDISSNQNPMHTYYAPCVNYTVRHRITNGSLQYWDNSTVITTTYGTINASFSTNITSGTYPLPVQFTDTSIVNNVTVDAWSWDFGDTGTSALQNPVHTYTTHGNFTVTFTATNSSCPMSNTTTGMINVSAPSGVTRQDLYMSQQYTLTVTFLDANTKSIVTGVLVSDSNGYSSNTTFGVYSKTYDYSSVTIYYQVNGYVSGSRTYSMTQDRTETIFLIPSSAATHNVIYQPTQIEFILYTASGMPLSGANIAATPLNFTAPDDWTNTLLGIDSSVNIQGTTVSGYTGTDGTWAAPMLASQEYQINIVGTHAGSPYSYSITLYPAVSPVQLTIPIGVVAIPTSAANVITYSLSNTSVNSSAQFVTMAYSDTSLTTSDLIFWVVDSTGTTIVSETYSGAAANSQTFNSTFIVLGGQSYTYGFSANTSSFEDPWINQTASFNINYHIGLLGQDPGTVELWLALAILVLWAAIGSIFFKHIVLIGIPIWYWFMALYFGWLPLNLYVNITLGVMLTLGVLIYVRYKENMLR